VYKYDKISGSYRGQRGAEAIRGLLKLGDKLVDASPIFINSHLLVMHFMGNYTLFCVGIRCK